MADAAENDLRSLLRAAETRALTMFDAVERAGFIAPGRTELEVQNDICALAERSFGVTDHWHRRIVRAGANTLCIYNEKPPVRVIAPDDTVFVDLGPVFERWQADVGRTYVVGDDPEKKRLVRDLSRLFEVVKAHYDATPDITCEGLYDHACRTAGEAGWLFGGTIAGHTIKGDGHKPDPDRSDPRFIARGNASRMRDSDAQGDERHWILEIHLVDKAHSFGGFYERLL